MPSKHGLWLPVADEGNADRFRDAINDKGKFTAVVTASEVRPRVAELCLVSLTGETADYLAISQAGQQIATDQKRLSVSRFVDLRELDLGEIRGRLLRRFRNRLALPADTAARIPPKTWENVLSAILAARPSTREQLDALREQIHEALTFQGHQEGGLEVFERDAVASAIQIWGGPARRKRVLGSASADTGRAPAPFISRLQGVSLREDAQVIHDSATFPGMEVARRYQVGAVELDNEQGERLTILHCNRQPLEQTLGVDLIYYNHVYDSFILVQYKRMVEKGKSGPAYRPASDSNYESEMQRMAEVEQLLQQAEVTARGIPNDFPLSTQPFFLKFCDTKAKAALDEGMVSGMYVPLQLWKDFIASADAKGKRGGVLVSWQNRPRNFNNSSFTGLLRSGWIGTSAGQSQALSEIIGKILEGQHMLIIAATSSGPSRVDYLRDDFGRFASVDDPLGVR